MPNNPQVLAALLVKVDRAKKHLFEFDAEFLSFLREGNPYETFFKDDPKAGERSYYLRVHREIPVQFSALIGDIAQNLRSALDHLAWHLVSIGPGQTKAKPQNIYFPIYETASEYRADKMRKIGGMSNAAIKTIDSIQPYYRLDAGVVGIGNGTPLFWLHEINKLDKHRLLVPAFTTMVSHTIPKSKRAEWAPGLRAAFGDSGKIFIASKAATAGPLKDGSKLCTLPISEVDDDMTFNFYITFGEPKWVCGKEIKSTLVNIWRIVDEIILRFDNEGLL